MLIFPDFLFVILGQFTFCKTNNYICLIQNFFNFVLKFLFVNFFKRSLKKFLGQTALESEVIIMTNEHLISISKVNQSVNQLLNRFKGLIRTEGATVSKGVRNLL